MRYNIVEYANGAVHVLKQEGDADTELIKVFDGPYAWERAKEFLLSRIPDNVIVREEIFDV